MVCGSSNIIQSSSIAMTFCGVFLYGNKFSLYNHVLFLPTSIGQQYFWCKNCKWAISGRRRKFRRIYM